MNEEQHSFFKEVCMNTEICASISVIPLINGVVVVDFDPAKNGKYNLKEAIARIGGSECKKYIIWC